MAVDYSGARDGLSSVTKGTFVMLLGTLGYVGENFLSRVLLARTLTPIAWGTFSLGLVFAGLLTSLGALGLPQAVARQLPFVGHDPERRAVVRSAFAFALPSALAVSALLFALSAPLGRRFPAPNLGITLEFFSIAVTFAILSSVIAAVFQGYEQVLPNALYVQILNPMLFIGALLVLEAGVPFHFGYVGALTAYLVASAVTLVTLVVYARSRLRRLLPAGPVAEGGGARLFLFAAPLLAVGVFTYLTGSADTLVLGIFRGNQVGYYTAALSLARLLVVGVGSLGYIFLPVTARFVRLGDMPAVRITYATATKWMLLTSLPLFLVFFFLPGRSLGFVYGSSYASTTLPLQIVVLGAFASTLVGPAMAAQVSFGQTRLLLYNSGFSASLDAGLSFWLVPLHGTTGAAIAWASSTVAFPVLSTIELATLREVHPFMPHYVLPMVATSVPLALLFAFIPFAPPLWFLPILAVLVGLAFVVVVFATGSVDQGDRILLELVEKMFGFRLPLVRRLGSLLARRGQIPNLP